LKNVSHAFVPGAAISQKTKQPLTVWPKAGGLLNMTVVTALEA